MRSTLLLSVAALAVAGCGDHGIPPGEDMAMSSYGDMSAVFDIGIPNDATRIVTYTMFAADLAQALCAHAVACGQLDSAQMAACIERNTRKTGWDQDVEIMKGRVEINELQCIAAVQASACDKSDTAAWVSRCLQFLYIPHVATGAACVASAECSNGYCQHAGSDAAMPEQVTGCGGTCQPPKGDAAPCRLNSDCASDSFCSGNQCTKLSSASQACFNLFGQGSGQACQFGLLCPSFSMTPTCVVPTTQMAVGGACDPIQGNTTPTPPCGAGMYCQLQYTASTTACAGPADCPFGDYCDTGTGFCQTLNGGKCATKIAKNAACDPNNEGFFSFAESQCVDGSTCYKAGAQTSTTCQPFGSANADCAADATCKVGLYCNTSFKCAPWIADGQMCNTATYCAGGGPGTAACIADNADAGTVTTCQQAKSIGATCNPGFEDAVCQNADLPGSSYCAPGGSSGVCAPKCF